MLSNEFADEEHLFRAIHPSQWDVEESKPSSGAFKDKNGLSIDRQADRDISTACSYILNNFPNSKAIAHFTTKTSKAHGAFPKYNPTTTNPYHSLLIREDGNLKLPGSTLNKLSDSCLICFQKEDV